MDETLRKRLKALTAAGRAQSLDFEGVAARVATDRFVSIDAPDAASCARYEEFMLGALSHLDAPTALRIAERLAPCGAAPASVLSGLIALGPGIATFILAAAPALPARLLLDRAATGAACEAAAIAARQDIDRTVVGALARRLEADVLRALAGNSAVAIDRGALIALTQRARVDVELGRLLLARDEAALDRSALFLSADAAARRRILLDAARRAMSADDNLVGAFDAARLDALAAAEAGDGARFCSILARALRVGRATVERLALDESGEPIGLFFAAMGLAATESERPLLTLRRDLAAALADPMSGLRLALQAPPKAACAVIASLIPARQQAAAGEFARATAARTQDGKGAAHGETATIRTFNRA